MAVGFSANGIDMNGVIISFKDGWICGTGYLIVRLYEQGVTGNEKY